MNKTDRQITNLFISPSKRWVRHLLLQAAILLITSAILWDPANGAVPDRGQIKVWGIYYLAMNVLVYINIYRLSKPLLLNNRITAYVLSVAGLIGMLVLVIGALQTVMPEPAGGSRTPVFIGIVSSVAALGLFFAGTSALVLFRQWILASRRRAELEAVTAQTELQALKNQINPHFLFNMLNNCYLLVRKRRPEAALVLFRLEDLLRYQIGGSRRESIALSEEISFILDFLNLEKVRRDDFNFTVEDGTGQVPVMLPPMLFVPFVENAVKHGESGNGAAIAIGFELVENRLIFTAVNSKPFRSIERRGPGGLGLNNIRRRLELLYPERHELTIEDGNDTYSVTLKLVL